MRTFDLKVGRMWCCWPCGICWLLRALDQSDCSAGGSTCVLLQLCSDWLCGQPQSGVGGALISQGPGTPRQCSPALSPVQYTVTSVGLRPVLNWAVSSSWDRDLTMGLAAICNPWTARTLAPHHRYHGVLGVIVLHNLYIWCIVVEYNKHCIPEYMSILSLTRMEPSIMVT
jgi:hypothetical protein